MAGVCVAAAYGEPWCKGRCKDPRDCTATPIRGTKGAARKPRRVRCAECGKYYADPPSRLCPGCEAYQEHQA